MQRGDVLLYDTMELWRGAARVAPSLPLHSPQRSPGAADTTSPNVTSHMEVKLVRPRACTVGCAQRSPSLLTPWRHSV